MSVEYGVIRQRLESVIDEYGTERDYIIYPFGEWGRMVKSVLNIDFGIQEKAIIDNSISRKKTGIIENDSFMDECKDDRAIVLISSVKSEIHSELVDVVTNKGIQYVDLFKEESAREAEWKAAIEHMNNWNKSIQKNTLKVMEKAEKLGILKNYHYHPENTKSLFYLPFMFIDCIQQELFLTDDYKDINMLKFVFYEFKDGFVERYVKGKTVIDAGANIGNHTLFFMNEVQAERCYSFEPVKQTYRILKENIIINDLTENVVCFRVGLGKEETKAEVADYNFTNIGGTGLITNDDNDDNGEIDIKPLDSYTYDGDVRLIKIDVEGMELDVVKGALQVIETNRPVLMIESFEKYEYLKEVLEGYNYSNIPLGPNDYLFFPSEL